MSRSVRDAAEKLRATQARSQQADRISHDDTESEDDK